MRALEDQLFDSKELNVMSLAGGPCSAAVGFAIWSHHRARFHSKHLKVKVSVYDLEAGWKPTCEQAQSAVQSTLASGAETGMEGAEIEIKWGGTCDLLQTTGKKMNAKIRASISEQQLLNFLTSCGCIDSRDDIAIETATSAGGFFHSLLWYLKVGTLILFVETSFNLAKAFGNMNGAYGKKLDRLYTSKAESDLQGLAGVFLYRVVASDSEEQTSDLYTTMRDLHIQVTFPIRLASMFLAFCRSLQALSSKYQLWDRKKSGTPKNQASFLALEVLETRRSCSSRLRGINKITSQIESS